MAAMVPAGPAELAMYHRLLWGVALAGLASAGLLLFVAAPYGRHARSGWGPTLPSRHAWIWMESPSVLWFAAVFAAGRHATEPIPLALASLWLAHYVQRTFIYPVRMYPDPSHRTPVAVAAMGFAFNLANAYLNARWISEVGSYGADLNTYLQLTAGAALFGLGYATNRWADRVLRELKAQGRGYQIPRGGLYRWISCPNYLGELVEWLGWAIAAASPAGWVFAWFTAANLVPRALAHHRWYRQRFADYPPARRAVVPFVL